VTEQTERLVRWEQERKDQVQTWRLVPVVKALQALRGMQCTVAVTTGAALGDRTRFENPRQLMRSLGLTPSQDSTGERRRQRSITKAGNTHARRALIEGAWASRYPAKVSRPLPLRLEKVPKPIQDMCWKAQGRLCNRYRQLLARGKTPTRSGRHRPGTACVYVGDGPGGPADLIDRDRCTPTSRFTRFDPSSGRDAAPGWCNPRWREEAERTPRA
jgi:hypothetical protein